MLEINLLDCTLRDGAHVNKGNFGYENIKTIVSKLVDSRVNIIELGFLEDITKYNKDYTYFNNIEQASNLVDRTGDSEFSVMLRPDRCDISKIEKSDTKIHIIRIAFYQEMLSSAIKYAERVMDCGYKCYLNPINITNYSMNTLNEVISACNEIKPNGVSIVDTFGALNLKEFRIVTDFVNNKLDPACELGLHLHENLSMSFGLVQDYLLNNSMTHNTIIDGSLNGIGRIPGNLPIELIADFLNKEFKTNYGISFMLEAIDKYIKPIKSRRFWGYSPEYFISATKCIHRSYPEYFIEQKKISLVKCLELIIQIYNNNKGHVFDQNYAQSLLEISRDT